jgi:drug/metabolite transporter (DMT)-like permease
MVAAAVLSPAALHALNGRWRVVRRSWRLMAVYGLVGVAAVQVAYFNAVARLTVGVAILLTCLAIVFIVASLWARHGHRPTPLTMAGGVAALGGLALMLGLSGGNAPKIGWIGVLWGLATAVASTIYFLQSAATSPPAPGASLAVSGAGDGALPPVVLAWAGMLIGAAALGAVSAVGLLPLQMSGRAVALFGGECPGRYCCLGWACSPRPARTWPGSHRRGGWVPSLRRPPRRSATSMTLPSPSADNARPPVGAQFSR